MTKLTFIALALLTTLSAQAEDNVQQVKVLGLQFGCSVSPMANNPEIRVLTESKDGERKTTFQINVDDQDQLYVLDDNRQPMIIGRIEEGVRARLLRACERQATNIAPIRYQLFKDLKIYRYTEAGSFRVEGRTDCRGSFLGPMFGVPQIISDAATCRHHAAHDVARTDNYDAFVRGQRRVDLKNYNFNWRRMSTGQQVSELTPEQEEATAAL